MSFVCFVVTQSSQLEFPSLAFPGRKALTVGEICAVLDVCENHVLNLIESGQLVSINVACGSRNHPRIPIESWHAFLKARSSLNVM